MPLRIARYHDASGPDGLYGSRRSRGIGTQFNRGTGSCGLRNARAKSKKLGRPSTVVDAARIGRLRAQGRSIREIASELGYSRSLVHKTLAHCGSFRVANVAD